MSLWTFVLAVIAGLFAFELWGSVPRVGQFVVRVCTAVLSEQWRAIRRDEFSALAAPCEGETRLWALCRLMLIVTHTTLTDCLGGQARWHPVAFWGRATARGALQWNLFEWWLVGPRWLHRRLGDLESRALCRVSWQLFLAFVNPALPPSVAVTYAGWLRDLHLEALDPALGDLDARSRLRVYCAAVVETQRLEMSPREVRRLLALY
jgi:hypothetical protein